MVQVRVAWLRAIAFVRRSLKQGKEASTQDGDGIEATANLLNAKHSEAPKTADSGGMYVCMYVCMYVHL